MFLTEKQAREKWCPKAGVQGQTRLRGVDGLTSIGGGFNRYPTETDTVSVPAGAMCIASACMAWRFEMVSSTQCCETEDERIVKDGRIQFRPIPPEGDGWREVNRWRKNEDGRMQLEPKPRIGFTTWYKASYETSQHHKPRGYCGAFGKPDEG